MNTNGTIFKPGDRVEYVGKAEQYVNPGRIGWVGTVVSYDDDITGIKVKWDDSGKEYETVYSDNIELISAADDTYDFYINLAETFGQVALYARDAADNYLAFSETSDKLNELINSAIERLNDGVQDKSQ